MKKLTLVLAVVAALASCSDEHNVKLGNGSVVKAFDHKDRDYKPGDTVCLYQGSYHDDWEIEEDGDMKDTLEYSRWVNTKGDTVGYLMEWRIGVVQ